MCEQPVRTRVRTPAGWRGLQEFLILDRGEAPIEAVELEGIAEADADPGGARGDRRGRADRRRPLQPGDLDRPDPRGPGIREAIAAAPAPVVAVSPLVGGRAIKGPTDAFIAALGRPVDAAGVASLYAGVIDAIVVDADDDGPAPPGIEVLACPTLMEGAGGRRALAERVIEFVDPLTRGGRSFTGWRRPRSSR